MIARNCTMADLNVALATINAERYQGNIRFKKIEPDPRCKTGIRFTLTVRRCTIGKGKNKRTAPGVRRGIDRPYWDKYTPKRIHAACWHVHGYFFEALFRLAPEARIKSGSFHNPAVNGWITKNGGNWKDSNIGSERYPFYFSEACECAEQGID